MTELQLGVQLMLYGLGGVFATLILFYLLVKVLGAFSKRKKKDSEAQ